MSELLNRFKKSDFGKDFIWGAAASAFQTEGASNVDGKSPSIWDTFVHNRKNNFNSANGTEFYSKYKIDLNLLKKMHFSAFRFSASWSRILPQGTGKINQQGIDFYNRLIDSCLSLEVTPWITVYHWDLPQCLEDKGGWTNREIVKWFEEYAAVCSKHFGDRVKNWIVLNEPLAFTALGYLLGKHAPRRKGLNHFLPALHHAALCQAEGARTIKNNNENVRVGSTFSCSVVEPFRNNEKDCIAAMKLDAALNRLFVEPALGLGYPLKELPELSRIEDYFLPGDEKLLPFDFDFIGLQYYFRVVTTHTWLPPFHIKEIKAGKRHLPTSTMGYEIFPQGLYRMIKKFSSYNNIRQIIITECGVCVPDKPGLKDQINDTERTHYHVKSLETILNCRREGIPVDGFFAWSLTDNFEWSEGYLPRFGLVYIDYPSQKRILKDSGKWFQKLLNNQI